MSPALNLPRANARGLPFSVYRAVNFPRVTPIMQGITRSAATKTPQSESC